MPVKDMTVVYSNNASAEAGESTILFRENNSGEGSTAPDEELASFPRRGSMSGSDDDCEIRSSNGNGRDDMSTFEDVLNIVGTHGRWQIYVFVLSSFCGFCTAMHNLVYAFIGATPNHWCQLPSVPGFSESELKDVLIPKKEDGELESCFRYSYSWYGTKESFIVEPNTTQGCDGFDFDHSEFQNTIVTQWDLVCDDTFWASSVQAMYMFGILCGSSVFGAVSDKLGRRKALLISTIIFVVAGPLVSLSSDFRMVMVTRFLLAFGSPGIYGTSFVLAIEVLDPNWRAEAGNFFCFPFALGFMALPGFAYLIRDWKMLQLAISAPSLLLFVTWYFLPESPRWLMGKGRSQEAEAILRQAAKWNRKDLPLDFSDIVKRSSQYEKQKNIDRPWTRTISSVLSGYIKLLRSPKLRLRTLCIYVCWASISLTYYGISLNAPNLHANRYIYTLIGGALEIPSYLMVPFFINRLGRKPVFSGFLFVCSAALLSSLFFHDDSLFIVYLSLFGKLVIGAAYSLIYLYATELMPTLLRTYGLGTASMVGRVGSIFAPYIVDMVGKDNKSYPSVVFGCVSLISGFLSLLLPETKDRRLPETVDDVELGRV